MSSPSPNDRSPKAGETRLGKYRVLRKLGRGGMGIVYAAEDTLLKRPVAIKILSSNLASNPDAMQRFLHEARAVARLIHPNVVAVYEIDQVQGRWFIAMELISGGSLEDYLATNPAGSWRESTRQISDACQGLIAAHRVGLIHRDIKPANLMRTEEGQVKLVDFGLAKQSEQTSGLTAPGTVLGTPYFMSPEQWRNEPLNDLSDVYSLGATYYALLTRQPPYVRRDPLQVMYACCSEPAPDPREKDAEIPDECAAIVLKAMAKEPEQRYANAQAMLDDLRSISRDDPASGTPVKTVSIASLDTLPPRAAPRALSPRKIASWFRSPGAAAGMVLVGVASAIFVWMVWGDGVARLGITSTHGTKSAEVQDGWVSLWNGQDLEGWWPLKSPPGEWTVEDGQLVGRLKSPGSDPSSYLMTNRNDYGDFECRAEILIVGATNSGIFFRCNSESSLPQGLEVNLGSHQFGRLHRTWGHGEQPVAYKTDPIDLPSNQWLTVEISARGPQVVVRLNGVVTGETTEHASAPKRGHLALQLFDPGAEIRVRRFEIRELP